MHCAALVSFHFVSLKTFYCETKIAKTKTKMLCTTNPTFLSSNVPGKDDVVIVGAGVAGSALAYALATDGRKVHLIERNLKEPDKVCGEVLLPGGYLKLLELGLEDCVRGIDAQVLLGYKLSFDGKSQRLPYPLEDYGGNEMGGRSFHHGRFVQNLRLKAASLSNVKLEQGSATGLIEEKGIIKGVRYKNEAGDEVMAYAPLTVVSDGCFSSLRKFLSKPEITKPSHVVALTIENHQMPDRDHLQFIMGNPVCMFMYPISSFEMRCGIDIPSGTKLPSISNGQMADFLKTVMLPLVPAEIQSAFLSSLDKGQIRTMPVSCMPAVPRVIPGALLLGDALNMRHAIFSGGMTVALHDVALIRHLFMHVNLDDTTMVMKSTNRFYSSRKRMAFRMNLVADFAYKVFYTTPDEIKKLVQQTVLIFFSMGGDVKRVAAEILFGLALTRRSLVFGAFVRFTYLFGSLIFAVASPKQACVAALWLLDATRYVVLRLWSEKLMPVGLHH